MLTNQHREHLLSEGFTDAHLPYFEEWGWNSIDEIQASALLGWPVESGGLHIPHGDRFFQIRMDDPKGKAKYLGPKKTTPEPWLPSVCGDPIVVTEGAKDTAAIALHAGVDCISITGVACWKKLADYPSLEVILYDADAAINPNVFRQLVEAGRALGLKVQTLPPVRGNVKAGACEYFRCEGSDNFDRLLESAVLADDFLLSLPDRWKDAELSGSALHKAVAVACDLTANKSILFKDLSQRIGDLFGYSKTDLRACMKKGALTGKLNASELVQFLEANYDIKLNLLTQQLEMDGQQFEELEEFYLLLEEAHDIKIAKTTAIDALRVLAKRNAYHPLRDYLERCKAEYTPLSDEQFNELAHKLLGAPKEDIVSSLFLRKFLLSAVARVFIPGCKVDECLVLQGGQGSGKSAFFDILGGEFFSDSLGDLGSIKDDLIEVHSAWIHEWGEIERVTDKRSVGAIKHFLTKRKDSFRPPYGRQRLTFARSCVIVGTCNEDDFLRDATGNRRYPVIPAGNINLELTKNWREHIWAKAIEEFEKGVPWHYSKAETQAIEQRAKQFTKEDSLDLEIEEYLHGRTQVLLNQILADVLFLEPKEYKKHEWQVIGILKRLGWFRGEQKRTAKGVVRFWEPTTVQGEVSLGQKSSKQAEAVTEQEFKPNSVDVTRSQVSLYTPSIFQEGKTKEEKNIYKPSDTGDKNPEREAAQGVEGVTRFDTKPSLDGTWCQTRVKLYRQNPETGDICYVNGYTCLRIESVSYFSHKTGRLSNARAVVESDSGERLTVAIDDIERCE